MSLLRFDFDAYTGLKFHGEAIGEDRDLLDDWDLISRQDTESWKTILDFLQGWENT